MATDQQAFERVVLPHLDAAYNLARWLSGNEHTAADVVQEAFLRAMRFFDTFRGTDARPWLLKIVRNSYHTLRSRDRNRAMVHWDDEAAFNDVAADVSCDPQAALIRATDVESVRRAIQQLPDDYREVLVLREMEGLAYKEIADVVNSPIGTVMSRLSRARQRLAQILGREHGPAAATAERGGAP